MYSPASFETAYVQRASPTEPWLVTCVSSTLYAWRPKTSLVENSIRRSSVELVVVDEPPRERRPDEAGAAREEDALAARGHAASLDARVPPAAPAAADRS